MLAFSAFSTDDRSADLPDGAAVLGGSPLLVCWLIAAAAGPPAYSALDDLLASWLGLALLFAWTFSLFFHLCNGIRHPFWDVGYGFDLQAIYASGWAVVAVSIGLTLTAWIISFGMKG